MEKILKIEIPQGYEIDRQKSTFEKIIFKKIPENPKTWEEYCTLTKGESSYFTDCTNNICLTNNSGTHNEFSNRERARQFIALGKLLQLRDYWVKGYSEFRYAVYVEWNGCTAICDLAGATPYPITFPTEEMAKEFKDCFSDLIKQAYPLV